jgi:cytochrome bd-type quinol oxidase subunit 1
MDLIFTLLGAIFFDHFLLAAMMSISALLVVICRLYSWFKFSDRAAEFCRKLLVYGAVLTAAVLLISFFAHGQGIDRLALVPFLLAASPLIVSGLIAALIPPKA